MNKLSTERAIDALYTVRAYYASLTAGYPKGKDCKAIDDVTCSEIANSCLMGIKALEQERSRSAEITQYRHDCEKLMEENERLKKALEQEPCEDCISRQDAIDALGEKPLAWTESEYELGLQNQWQSDVNALKALPSVQPERKNGKWELVHDFDDISDAMKPLGRVVCCSECGYPENRLATNFCPNCGAKMEVE